ncbi:MAG: hypothetical protein WDM76_06335 [Limisphaerales bacterium]
MLTLWFFVWGVIMLAVRIAGFKQTEWLGLGLFVTVPLALFAFIRAHKQRPAFEKIRARYDQLKHCGGVMMSEEIADMTAWQAQLPSAAAPKIHWHSGRMMILLCVASLFAATALLLPERLTHFKQSQSLEVGQIVDQLQAEVQALQEEKIVEDKKAEDLQQQLARIKEDSSGLDPSKTWEALDHIKEANAETAQQAAEEALTKMSGLTQAELLASAMEQAAQNGMNNDTATQATQTLAGMLKAAKLEDGLLKGENPAGIIVGFERFESRTVAKTFKCAGGK